MCSSRWEGRKEREMGDGEVGIGIFVWFLLDRSTIFLIDFGFILVREGWDLESEVLGCLNWT